MGQALHSGSGSLVHHHLYGYVRRVSRYGVLYIIYKVYIQKNLLVDMSHREIANRSYH